MFLLLCLLCLLPAVTPALALAVGVAFALALGDPFPWHTGPAARLLLQASVVGLGFGLPLGRVLAAGAAGFLYTAGGIAATLALGALLGRWLRVEGHTAFLVTAGTSICGGSAIAAVGPVIGAGPHAMAVALGTVFLLNGVALYVFPLVGGALELTQGQFALWAAIAIHDTSSVVGAAASYGAEALRLATVLKLSRALWIFPLALGTALWMRRRGRGAPGGMPAIPWFIGLFLLAALMRSLAPAGAVPLMEGLVAVARQLLVLTLFLIGAGLSVEALRGVGWRPLVLGLLLWAAVSVLTLAVVLRAPAF
ncbi:MAG: putative sulfate exporter family transporter [Gemmatimonadota bacterium]